MLIILIMKNLLGIVEQDFLIIILYIIYINIDLLIENVKNDTHGIYK